MTAHVSEESLVGLALGEGAPQELEHAAACEVCALRVHESREALELLRRTEIPEPSPLYWEALRSGVRRRIAEEHRRLSAWTLLVPLAAAAAIVAAFWVGPAPRAPLPTPSLPAWSPLPAASDDAGWRVLEGLALTDVGERAWDEPSGLAPYLTALTDEESRALAQALRAQGSQS